MNKENIENMIENGRNAFKKTSVRVFTAGTILLGTIVGGTGCQIGSFHFGFDEGSTPPIAAADKPKETPSNGVTAEQLAEFAKSIGSERIITIVVPSDPVAPEKPVVKQQAEQPVAPKNEAIAVPKVDAPQATKVTGGETAVIKSFSIQGAPDRVDAKNVDTAKGEFKNTIGLGSEMMLGEKGVLKVGWDFPQEQFKAAGESIYHFDPGNQHTLDTSESFVNFPEGAFGMLNGNAMKIEVSGNGSARFELNIPGPVNNENIVIMRGLYRDGSSPEDRNRIAHITNYTPGAVLYDMYPKGGFISQGHVEQVAENALTNSPNCGAEACRTITLYMFDINTGAYSVITISLGKPWTPVTSNWK